MPKLTKKVPSSTDGNRQPQHFDLLVGAKIRQRRNALGLAQADLAKVVGITQRQMHKYEVGLNRIAASRLSEIARALDVPVAWFFNEFSEFDSEKKAPASLAASESRLLGNFRMLGPQAQSQLIEISEILHHQAEPQPNSRRRP